MTSPLTERLDAAERKLRELQVELAAIRAETRPAQAPPVAAPVATPVQQQPPAPAPPQPKPQPAPQPSRSLPSLEELLARWDLVGARGLAVAGGIVTLLGIAFFFVLAANRGWIGPGERVLLGACAAGLFFTGGLEARRRFGPLVAALAAVGAGIGGWYTTLAAATIRYELISEPARTCNRPSATPTSFSRVSGFESYNCSYSRVGFAPSPTSSPANSNVAGLVFACRNQPVSVATAMNRWFAAPALIGAPSARMIS